MESHFASVLVINDDGALSSLDQTEQRHRHRRLTRPWERYMGQLNALTHLPLDKMAAIAQTIFLDFREWKILYFAYNFTEVCS